MKRQILIVMVLTLSLTALAQAASFETESREGRWDFSVMTRFIWGQDFTDDNGSSINFEDDLGWGFGFSKYMSEAFNLGLVFSWHSAYYTANAKGETDGDYLNYSNVLSTSSISLYGDYVFGSGKFKPYLSGNLGWTRANTNITADVDGGCYYYPYIGYQCATWQSATYGDDSFTYGLGLGLKLDLSPSAYLKIGYEHSWSSFDLFDSNDAMRIDLGFLL